MRGERERESARDEEREREREREGERERARERGWTDEVLHGVLLWLKLHFRNLLVGIR